MDFLSSIITKLHFLEIFFKDLLLIVYAGRCHRAQRSVLLGPRAARYWEPILGPGQGSVLPSEPLPPAPELPATYLPATLAPQPTRGLRILVFLVVPETSTGVGNVAQCFRSWKLGPAKGSFRSSPNRRDSAKQEGLGDRP